MCVHIYTLAHLMGNAELLHCTHIAIIEPDVFTVHPSYQISQFCYQLTVSLTYSAPQTTANPRKNVI